MDKIDLILIGAGRSGTTGLFEYIAQHPEINSSLIKEVIYFSIDDHFNRGEKYLSSFFDNAQKGKIQFTSDTYLLINPEAADRIYKYNPQVKLIALLRDPVDRAFSSYNYALNNNYIGKDVAFIDTLKDEAAILASKDIVQKTNLCHFHGSEYHKHLSMWKEKFGEDNLLIVTTRELKKPVSLLNIIFDFAGVSPFEVQPINIRNKSTTARSTFINDFFTNRNHPLRKLIAKPLQWAPLRKLLIASPMVESIKALNKKETKYRALSEIEKDFCDNYFKSDLASLKAEFQIEFVKPSTPSDHVSVE